MGVRVFMGLGIFLCVCLYVYVCMHVYASASRYLSMCMSLCVYACLCVCLFRTIVCGCLRAADFARGWSRDTVSSRGRSQGKTEGIREAEEGNKQRLDRWKSSEDGEQDNPSPGSSSSCLFLRLEAFTCWYCTQTRLLAHTYHRLPNAWCQSVLTSVSQRPVSSRWLTGWGVRSGHGGPRFKSGLTHTSDIKRYVMIYPARCLVLWCHC